MEAYHKANWCPYEHRFPEENWAWAEQDHTRFLHAAYLWIVNHPDEGMWCAHTSIARYFPKLLEWMEDENDAMSAELRLRTERDLFGCLSCIEQYYLAKKWFRAVNQEKYTAESLDCFFEHLNVYDRKRILNLLQSLPSLSVETYLKAVRSLCMELLLESDHLRDSSIFHLFSEMFKSLITHNDIAMNNPFKGVYLLTLHPDPDIREWAISTAVGLGPCTTKESCAILNSWIDIVQSALDRTSVIPHLLAPANTEFWESVAQVLRLFGVSEDTDYLESCLIEHLQIVDIIHSELCYRKFHANWVNIFYFLIQRLKYKFWFFTRIPHTEFLKMVKRAIANTNDEPVLFDCCELIHLYVTSIADHVEVHEHELVVENSVEALLEVEHKHQVTARVVAFAHSTIIRILCTTYTATPPRPPLQSEKNWIPILVQLLLSTEQHEDDSFGCIALIKTIVTVDTDEMRSLWLYILREAGVKVEDDDFGVRSEKIKWTRTLWPKLAEHATELPAAVKAAAIEACLSVALIVMDPAGYSEKLRSIASQLNESILEVQRLSTQFFTKLSTLPSAPDVPATLIARSIFTFSSSPDRALRGAFGDFLKRYCGKAQLDECLKVMLENEETCVHTIQGISDVIEEMARVSWSSCYEDALLDGCATIQAYAESQSEPSSGVSSLFNALFHFCRHVLLQGINHQNKSHFPLTMVRFFDMLAVLLRSFYNVAPFDKFLHQHNKWTQAFFQWVATTADVQRRWFECLLAILEALKQLGDSPAEAFVKECELLGQRQDIYATSVQMEKLASLLPQVDFGRINPFLKNLPKRSVEEQVVLTDEEEAEENKPSPLPTTTVKPIRDKIHQYMLRNPGTLASLEDSRRRRLEAVHNVLKNCTQKFEQQLIERYLRPEPPPKRAPKDTAREKIKQQLGVKGSEWYNGHIPSSTIADERKNESAKMAEKRRIELAKQKEMLDEKLRQTPKTTLMLDSTITISRIARLQEYERELAFRKRVAPSIDDLYKTVLVWDYKKLDEAKFDERFHEHIPLRFDSIERYVSILEPLLIEEFRASVKESFIEPSDATCKQMRVVESGKVNAFYFVTLGRAQHDMRADDLVLLSRTPVNRLEDKPPPMYLFGKVEKIDKNERNRINAHDHVRVRLYLDAPTNPRIAKCKAAIVVGSEWYVRKVVNMSTMTREYQALQSFQNFPLSELILRPTLSTERKFNVESELAKIFHNESMKPAKSHRLFNISQVDAIKTAVANTGFTLIQGPPGTGKSHTIVGLVSILLEKEMGPLLVCAHSNAAVDELVYRFLQGIYTTRCSQQNKQSDERLPPGVYKYVPVVVRVGKGPKGYVMRPEVEAVCLDRQIDTELKHRLSKELREFALNLKSDKDLRTSQPTTSANDKELQLEIKKDILNRAQIICTTLSTSGHSVFAKLGRTFETVIIDEAAQAVELSTLIPLKYGCKRCILVGDPQQLPATVKSQIAKQYQYEQSLFVRLMANDYPCSLLNVQYRMHQLIREFPSRHFYNNKIIDGPQDCSRPWHAYQIFSPLCFFDIKIGHSTESARGSLQNESEAQFILRFLQILLKHFDPNGDMLDKIGVISPYSRQIDLLKEVLTAVSTGSKAIEVCTVDAFQGREKDIIILSTVRAAIKGVGFLSDVRRMNVALTRAKSSLWIVGNAQSLIQNPHWKALIDFCRDNSRYFAVSNFDEFFKMHTPNRVNSQTTQKAKAPTTTKPSEPAVSPKKPVNQSGNTVQRVSKSATSPSQAKDSTPKPKTANGSQKPILQPMPLDQLLPSSATKQPSSGTQRTSSTTQRPTGVTQQPTSATSRSTSVTQQQPTSTTSRPTSVAKHSTTTTQRPASATQQTTSATQRPSGATQRSVGDKSEAPVSKLTKVTTKRQNEDANDVPPAKRQKTQESTSRSLSSSSSSLSPPPTSASSSGEDKPPQSAPTQKTTSTATQQARGSTEKPATNALASSAQLINRSSTPPPAAPKKTTLVSPSVLSSLLSEIDKQSK